MDEKNVEPVDLGHELRKGVEFSFAFAPVVFRSPVLDERLELGQLRALRPVGDGLFSGEMHILFSSGHVTH